MEVIFENASVVTKICRACLSGDEPFLELFDTNYSSFNEKLTLCEMLVSVAYIEVQLGDGLPDVICQSCAEKVNQAHNFKALCKRSEAVLREASIDPDHYFKIEESLQNDFNLAKAENDHDKEADCLAVISLSTKLSEDGLLSNALTSIRPTLTLRNTFTQDLNLMDTGQSMGRDIIIEEIKKNSSSEPDFNTLIFKPKHKFSSKKITDYEKSEPSNESEADEMSDDLNEQDHFLARSVEPEIFTCIICSQTFNQRSELRIHKKTHPADMRHQCPHCVKNFSRIYTLQQHITTHFDYKPHLCPICGKGFHLSGGLHQHIKYHQGIKSHACQICDKRFYTHYMMKEHMRYLHSDNRYNASCNVCGKKFTAKSTLTMHMRVHTGERPHVCKECGKQFTRGKYLRNHARKHTNQPPEQQFACEYLNCDSKLSSKASLQIHIKHKHSTERPFSCEVCFKSFPTKKGVKEHERVHTGEKPEICLLCDNKFVNKQSLKKHMRLHTGEKPYPCPHCDQTFISSSRVTDHIQCKHMERSQECQDCGKMFHLRRALLSHMKIHREGKRHKGKHISPPLILEVKQIVPEPGFEIIV